MDCPYTFSLLIPFFPQRHLSLAIGEKSKSKPFLLLVREELTLAVEMKLETPDMVKVAIAKNYILENRTHKNGHIEFRMNSKKYK